MPLPDTPPPRRRVRIDSKTGAVRSRRGPEPTERTHRARTEAAPGADAPGPVAPARPPAPQPPTEVPPTDDTQPPAQEPPPPAPQPPTEVPRTDDTQPPAQEPPPPAPQPPTEAGPASAPTDRLQRSSDADSPAAATEPSSEDDPGPDDLDRRRTGRWNRSSGQLSKVVVLVLLIAGIAAATVVAVDPFGRGSADTSPAAVSTGDGPTPGGGGGASNDAPPRLVVLGGTDGDALNGSKEHWLELDEAATAALGNTVDGCGLLNPLDADDECLDLTVWAGVLTDDRNVNSVLVVAEVADLVDHSHPVTGALGSISNTGHRAAFNDRLDLMLGRIRDVGPATVVVTTLATPAEDDPTWGERASALNTTMRLFADRHRAVHLADVDAWARANEDTVELRGEDGRLSAEATRRIWLEVIAPAFEAASAPPSR